MKSTPALPARVPALPARSRLRSALVVGLSLLLLTGSASSAGMQETKAPQTPAPRTKARQRKGQQATGTSPRKSHPAKHSRSKTKSRSSRARERAQRAPTPERISEVQSALAKAGHYAGQPTGKWDASTIQAMKNYQKANGLQASGKLDARTLEKLGLGSPTSGVGAPRPPAARPPAARPSGGAAPIPNSVPPPKIV